MRQGITFEYVCTESTSSSDIRILLELSGDMTLDEVFTTFEGFLLAAGYSAEGIKDYLAEED